MFIFCNKFSRIVSQNLRRYTQGLINEAIVTNGKSLVLEPLNKRELIRVRGEDAFDFLQGLTTNDMKHLGRNSSDAKLMYSMFLNKNGRVLYDAIIFSVPEPNTYLIECDKQVSSELRRLLRTYRVRRKVDIDPVYKDYKSWVALDVSNDKNPAEVIKKDSSLCALADPRVSDLGLRIITQSDVSWSDLAAHIRQNFHVKLNQASDDNNYDNQRFHAGIAEGVEDIPPGKYFPFETNGDLLKGLSFNKGCYIGQELTARIHHTGVVRKRYMPVQLTAPLSSKKTIQTTAGAEVGHVVSSRGNNALALVRLEKALKNSNFEIDGDPVYLKKPTWWPANLSGNQALQI